MDQQPLLTVWLMTYNHEAFVQQAIQSIQQQDFDDYEVIVTDNASQDRTPQLLQDYAAQDSRVILHLFPDNPGCCARYDPVVREARGRYIIGLSGDDWFAPGIFRAAVVCAETHAADLVQYGYEFQFFDDAGKLADGFKRQIPYPLGPLDADGISRHLEELTQYGHLESEDSLLRRVDFLREQGLWMENHWEDGPYVADMFAACQRYVAIPVDGYCYRGYLNPQQGVSRNSSSSSYYLRTAYPKSVAHTYRQYRSICRRTGQPIDFLARKYGNQLLGMLGSYLQNAAAKRDVYYHGSPFPPVEKLQYLMEMLSDPGVAELVADSRLEARLTGVVCASVRGIMTDCDPPALAQLCEQFHWLVGLTQAFYRLQRDFSFTWETLLDDLSRWVDHPANTLGLGRSLRAALDSIRDGTWLEHSLLAALLPWKGSKQGPVLYGAGAMSPYWVQILSALDIAPSGWIDRAKSGVLGGVPLQTPQEFADQQPEFAGSIFVTLYLPEQQQQAVDTLKELLPHAQTITFHQDTLELVKHLASCQSCLVALCHLEGTT